MAACGPGPTALPSQRPGQPAASATPAASPSTLSVAAPSRSSLPPSPSPSLRPTLTPTAAPTAAPLHAGCPATPTTSGPSAKQSVVHLATTNWSGYVARSTKAFGCLQGRWTEPTVSCPASGAASLSIWIGFDGEDGPSRATLEQIGTNVDCDDGQARTFAWFEILPQDRFEEELPLDVQAGDRIAASIQIVGRSYHLVIENLTSGRVADASEHSPGSLRQTAEWIVEAPTVGCPNACHVASLAHFSTVTFSAADAILNNRLGPISDGRWSRARLDLETRTGVVRARTGGLNPSGTVFSVVWRHR